jgi:uncharacterized protein YpuA (DUF1002 family)
MSNKNVSKDVLNTVNKKTGKNGSEKDIQKPASRVKPTTMQSEDQLRQLITQVSGLVNANVSENTVNEIIRAVKSINMSTDNIEHLVKMMSGRK